VFEETGTPGNGLTIFYGSGSQSVLHGFQGIRQQFRWDPWIHVITAQQPDVPAYTNCDTQLQNFAPDDGLKSPKHVEHLIINKDTL
jgi:hypothetical protein